ncbi:DUF6083 domain-containing protein [Streptomyces sp. S399]|uniref:DUF6083 domain-containing protein n=1 Tax=Streptomyces sp. S399 TaxID=3096009 RepID=UPI002A7EAAD9|nr:DUF6083 domain-containing protein [Streptomyces sp. S399]WPR52026.1 DUF6083 domain-containing protein [Streptomyces sp. S399]
MTATLVRAEHGQPLPERAEAVPSPGAGKPMTCRYCLAPGRWHTTVGGAWIPMEPDPFPAYRVPARHRWRIAPDGTALPLGRAVPADTCRVSHFSVCPARPAPLESPSCWRAGASTAGGAEGPPTGSALARGAEPGTGRARPPPSPRGGGGVSVVRGPGRPSRWSGGPPSPRGRGPLR